MKTLLLIALLIPVTAVAFDSSTIITPVKTQSGILYIIKEVPLTISDYNCSREFNGFVNNSYFISEISRFHYNVRHSLDVRLGDLYWKEELASMAETDACKCQLSSPLDAPGKNQAKGLLDVGETIYTFIENQIYLWNTTGQWYDRDTRKCTRGCNSCLPFLQMVAQDTHFVGCALANCTSSQGSKENSSNEELVFICYYTDIVPSLCCQYDNSTCSHQTEWETNCTCCPSFPWHFTTTTTEPTPATTTIYVEPELRKLAKENVTKANVNSVSQRLLKLMKEAPTTLDVHEISYASEVLYNIGQVNGSDKSIYNNVLSSIDILLALPDDLMRVTNAVNESSGRILRALEGISQNISLTPGSDGTAHLRFNTTRIAMDIIAVNCNKANRWQQGLAKNIDGSYQRIESDSKRNITYLTQVSIQFPRDDICQSSYEEDTLQDLSNSNHVQYSFRIFSSFNLFDEATVTSKDCSAKLTLNSYIPSASLYQRQNMLVGGHHSDLKKRPVQISFKAFNKTDPNLLHAKMTCGFWDLSDLSNVRWSTEGCSLVQSPNPQLFSCQCDHLTDFGLLTDISANDPVVCNSALRTMGLVTAVMSVIALAFLITATSLTAIRSRNVGISHISYNGPEAFQLFLLYLNSFLYFLLFILFSDQSTLNISDSGCIVVAGLLHWLFLSMATFGTARGLHFFRNYYLVFRKEGSLFDIGAWGPVTSLVAWGIAGIIVGIAAGTRKDLYDRQDQFCWLRPELIIFAVIVPMSVFILTNCVLFCIIWSNLLQKTRLIHFDAESKYRKWGSLVGLALGMLLIMGLPWLMSYFTNYSPNANAFHYLFTLLNGLLGVWLLLLYLWQEYLRVQRRRRKSIVISSGGTRLTSAPL